ncbi:MAG: hypothetical protein IKF07_06220 [Eubacterium sp.]|nr:hypothetical protein [Eubacterium sp.]
MLTYRIISRKNGRNVYEYIPEGDLRPGVIAIHDDGTREIVRDSEDDFKGVYRGMAFCGIDISKDTGTVACW